MLDLEKLPQKIYWDSNYLNQVETISELMTLVQRWSPNSSQELIDAIPMLIPRLGLSILAAVEKIWRRLKDSQADSSDNYPRYRRLIWPKLYDLQDPGLDPWLIKMLMEVEDTQERLGVLDLLIQRKTTLLPLLQQAITTDPSQIYLQIALQNLQETEDQDPEWLPPKTKTRYTQLHSSLFYRPQLRSGCYVSGKSTLVLAEWMYAGGLENIEQYISKEQLLDFAWSAALVWMGIASYRGDHPILQVIGQWGGEREIQGIAQHIRTWDETVSFAGLQALEAIGSESALLLIHRLSVSPLSSKKLREQAEQFSANIAKKMQLGSEDLADRLVADLGFDENGCRRIEIEEGSLVFSFDASLQLRIHLNGQPLKTMPKVTSEEANLIYKELKKEAPLLLRALIKRLEHTLSVGRLWTDTHFQACLQHPFLGRVYRLLLWSTEKDNKTLVFRIAEDNSFADIKDQPVGLGTTVQLLHPLQLSLAECEKWSKLLSDYAILQPFPQLTRPVLRLRPKEATGQVLHRFKGIKIPTNQLGQLIKEGWHNNWNVMTKEIPKVGLLSLKYEPGFFLPEDSQQRITDVTLETPWAQADPVVLSEVFLHIGLLR